MRSTLTDIAKDSGVSTATVDRVLNNRAGVSSRTRSIVMETATRLGYFGQTEPAAERIRLDFVLPEGTKVRWQVPETGEPWPRVGSRRSRTTPDAPTET